MADGGYRWQGHAPAPDAARVEAIDAGYDEAEVHAFAEPARVAAVARIEQALAAAREGDLAGAASALTRARSVLEGLNPAALQPRRGLAGLFDSHGKRLKAFREAFRQAAASLSDAAADLTVRVEGAARRSGALDALPLIRGAQNADARAAEALRACHDGVAAWRQGWLEALGLAGKRPKKVRPDRERLLVLRDDLLARIDRGLAELKASDGRRADIAARLGDLRAPL